MKDKFSLKNISFVFATLGIIIELVNNLKYYNLRGYQILTQHFISTFLIPFIFFLIAFILYFISIKIKKKGNKKMITIGIDIDSTINKAHYYDIIHGREFCQQNKIDRGEYLNCLSIKEMFKLTDEEYRKYMEKFFPWNCNYNIPELAAASVIRTLIKDHRIIIITARDENYSKTSYTGEMMKKDTKNWFRKFNIPYNDIIFSCTDKAKVCKENNVDIMIDDDPVHILSCADAGIHTIIMSQSYNEYIIGHINTMYARGWIDVYHLIKLIK